MLGAVRPLVEEIRDQGLHTSTLGQHVLDV
jgi:hypothetical protein